MENTFCTDLDETVIQRIHALSQALNAPAKTVVENAVNLYASQIKLSDISSTQELNLQWLDQTCGAWKRDESTEDTIQVIRELFNQSMMRHQ